MRSQFPRHIVGADARAKPIVVSISDEKPVPSPRGLWAAAEGMVYVSISDEKPVPSPL